MSHRMLPFALLLVSAMPNPAGAGWTEVGNPGGTLHGTFKGSQFRLSGELKGFKVTGKHGKSKVVDLPRGTDLSRPLMLPEGTWHEITLLFDGPVTVRATDGAIKLQVDSLTVTLEDPDAHEVYLDWTLPDDWSALSASPDRLLQALEDGALARPELDDE